MIISFDFDQTIWDESAFSFTESLTTLRQFISEGHQVVIVTSRKPKWAEEAKQLLLRMNLDLEVFSCPWDLLDGETWEQTRNKSEMLIKLGAAKHFDDLWNEDEFSEAKDKGIEILPPPHWNLI